MIVVFGSINVDLVARVPSIPRPGETVLSVGYDMLFGGKGANQAVAAARALEGTGIATQMAGRVGADEFGRAALANLAANSVGTEFVASGSDPTGCAFIAVDNQGENAITVASGANMSVRASDLGRALGPGDILLLQMEVPAAEALSVAWEARAAGATVIWNFAPAKGDLAHEELASILAATTIFVVNEHEAVAAASALGCPAPNPETAAKEVSRNGAQTVILTSGASGASVYSAGACTSRAPALHVDVADTTGAGDTFAGVLAARLAEGEGLSMAVETACLGASLACRKPGAQAGMPRRAELMP